VKPDFDQTLHHGHALMHATYFGAVAIEAHGIYGKIAGVLLALTVIQTVRVICVYHRKKHEDAAAALREEPDA